MWKWIKRIGLGFVCLIVVLLLNGAAYQYISTKNDECTYPPPGKLVDIGGYRLHILCSGDGGGPTVILETGLGCNCLDWALVQPEIAKFTRVCSYDRGGYGWSDASPLERTSQNIVDELHTLLKNARENGPYILVGHSFGGANVSLYASQYPDEVVGVVLVDAAHEYLLQEMPDVLQKNSFEKILFHHDFASFWASVGVFRLIYHYVPAVRDVFKIFPPDIQNAYLAAQSTTKFTRAFTQEAENFDQSLNQLKEAGSLGNKPLIVISAGKILTSEETGLSKEVMDKRAIVWEALQKDLVTKSTKGKRIIAVHSTHAITREQPEIIVEAVREIWSNQK